MAIAIATAMGAGAALAQSPSDYDGVVDITIRNNSTTTAIHGPVAVAVRARNMVDGGYITDGTDVLFTNSANQQTGGIPGPLDSNESTWWWYADVETESSTDVRLFAGGPENSNLFPLGDDSSIEVDDADSLDITGDLVLEATVAAAAVPEDGDAWVVHKRGAYMLGLDAEGLFAFVDHGASSYTDVAIDGPGDTTGIGSRSGCSSNWECLSDGSDSTYVHPSTIGSYQTDTYSLADAGLPGFVDISRVDVHTRRNSNGYTVRHGLRLNGSDSTKVILSYVSVPITYVDTITRPGGGTWTVADLEDLQVYLSVQRVLGFSTRVYDVFVRVHHNAIPEMVRSSPIAHGAVHDVRLEFDDPDLSLYVDDNLVDTTGSAGSISTNSNTLAIGGGKEGSAFRGGVGSVRIGDTSGTTTAYALDLQMAPPHITPGTDGSSANDWEWTGTIDDQSASSNDATYTITYDPTDVDIVIGPLILAPNQRPGQATTDTPDLVGDVPLAVFLTPGPSPKSSPGRDFFIGPIIESAESSGMPADAWWILVGTLIVGPATALGFKHFRSYVVMSIAGVVGIFVISQIAGLSVWWTAFSALWKAGMIGITQYWRGN